MKPPAIVLVTTSFPIAGDGSEAAGSFVGDLALELARHTEVRVVCPGPTDGCERWGPDVEVHRFAAPAQALSTLKPWHPGHWRWIARVLRGGLRATRAAVAAQPRCHILALWALPCGDWARRVAGERGIEYSVWMLGSDVWSLGRIPVVRQILAHTIRRARGAYADGYQLADDARLISGRPIEFLPSTRHIDTRDIPPRRAQTPQRLLFLGRWHPNKGVDLLLDALALLADADWARIERVDIQGGGPMDAEVRARVAALAAAGRPVHAGRFLGKPEAEQAIVAADWLLLPSRIESIPVVFSDAIKLGRPLVSMPVGDLPRLLATGCGVLSASVTAQGFAEAMSRALKDGFHPDPTAMQTLAEQFSVEAIAQRLLASACRSPAPAARETSS